jgi:hypothetical protein
MKTLLISPPRFNGMPVEREDKRENTIPMYGFVVLGGHTVKR